MGFLGGSVSWASACGLGHDPRVCLHWAPCAVRSLLLPPSPSTRVRTCVHALSKKIKKCIVYICTYVHFSGQRGSITIIKTAILECGLVTPSTLSKGL